ncbi:Chitinase [Actinokineospora spheciospongiae]|uniref:chitinase n=1 Tax=Actinokineospora spheciospongiae TaxID=909613 RepID=W7IJ83_9PSEU|nr:glycosyl hydrolase family 18 protein [Actinokineospora spheciospongiae]EWC60443.1 Chitinase [Actinokineospora spheciospongiae]
MPSTARRALAAVSAALAASAGLVLAGGGSADAANLLANPGFESGTSGWTCSGATTDSDRHSGSAALKGTPSGQDNARCSQTVAVTPGAQYTLSAWVKGAYAYLGATGTTTGDASTWTPAASTWTRLSVAFTAASSSATVYVHGWYGQPAYLADDLALDGPGTAPPTTTPTSTTPPTTTPPTTTTTRPTTPPPATGLPKHVLTGYWQNFYNGAKPLRLADVPTTYDIIAVSFADAVPTTPGAVTFTLDPGLSSQLGGYTDAQFRADVATVRARGQKVILSVGGEKGTISVGDATASANFAASVGRLIDDYGFDGVDIDLENGINAQHMGSALRRIHAEGGTVITMAPQTIDMQSTSGGYFQLALAVKDILTIVNMQYYNSGAMLGCDGKVYSQGSIDFLTALACIQLQGGLRADQVGLGLPASPSGAGGGYQSPANVSAGLTCLAKGTGCGAFRPSTTYPTLRGAMTWSINWDASNGYAFANAVSATLDTLP